MTTMTIIRFFTWSGMGENWAQYLELYYVPSRLCGLGNPCPCGGMEKHFSLAECVPCPVQPFEVAWNEDSQGENSYYGEQRLTFDRTAVFANCPASMVPAEVVVEQYEDGQYVRVETFLNH
jgi:hypothetical protein